MSVFGKGSSGRVEQQPRRGEGTGLTIIAVGTQITGDIVSDAVVKVEGVIEGTVRAGSQLLVAPGAVIHGDVFAREVLVGGMIDGLIEAGERVEIQAGAQVDGDITTQRIQIQDGGRVNGQISMQLPRPADASQPAG
ncbi:MAG: polymer-forming cytoskeletal protein [Gemmatimonadota bacterium]|nr:polymer-forming cytoskeletal protein [Gemmatimonadota bacterium]